MQILYQDEDLVIINKPAELITLPTHTWDGGCVTNELGKQGILPWNSVNPGPEERFGVVSRLDVGTSGALVIAKSKHGFYGLKEIFMSHKVTKIYHGLVQGRPKLVEQMVDAPIGRHPNAKFKFAVLESGKKAQTIIKVLDNWVVDMQDPKNQSYSVSLCEFTLLTGRTHQIRVHCSAIGHNICGDKMYGANMQLAQRLQLNRQWLHSYSLSFNHPITQQPISVTAPYPPELNLPSKNCDGNV